MKYKKPFFISIKESDKESTGDRSVHHMHDIGLFNSGQKRPFSDFCLVSKNKDFFIKSDELSFSNDLFYDDEFNLNFENAENFDLKNFGESNKLLYNYNYMNEISFEKNRNNLNNNLFKEEEKSKEDINPNLIRNKSNRCDSLLIKFKVIVGKWFISNINKKIKILRNNSIIKRGIKFYSFNYKKFTLKVSYSQNKEWLKYKMRDLLLLGEEENQIKNEKGIKSLYKKNKIELNEIKKMLESSYEEIIKKFYLSKEFDEFKEDKRVKELDFNFEKVMNMSLLENYGFIKFFETRRGNNRK